MAAPTGKATRLTDTEYKVCARLRLRVPLWLGEAGAGCRNRRSGDATEEPAPGGPRGECGKPLDTDAFHT